MQFSQTRVLFEASDVDARLHELGLHKQKLASVCLIAMNASANTTAYHCKNAAGTYSYHEAIPALRRIFVGPDWEANNALNIEGIWNPSLRLRITFSNVISACNKSILPKPRSEKGPAAEKLCRSAEPSLFGELPQYYKDEHESEMTYYLMLDRDGYAELSRPLVQGGTFFSFRERIFLGQVNDSDILKNPLDVSDAVDGFDPDVIRR